MLLPFHIPPLSVKIDGKGGGYYFAIPALFSNKAPNNAGKARNKLVMSKTLRCHIVKLTVDQLCPAASREVPVIF